MKSRRIKALLVAFGVACALCVAATPAYAVEAGKAAIGDTEYDTLEDAVAASKDGDTITLGAGKYTLYNKTVNGAGIGAYTKGKSLTFVGAGQGATEWGIGATIPDPNKFGTEYNGDYSFDGANTVTFKDMTLQSGSADYLGFIRINDTVVDNCTVNGKTFYWGYSTATFASTTFNAPEGDYALWTYSSPVMKFDGCVFNGMAKLVNVYTDYSAGKHDIELDFNKCAFRSSFAFGKQALNVNDSNMGACKYAINFTGMGEESVSGCSLDKTTCSHLFGFGGKSANDTGRTLVTFDGTTVWQPAQGGGKGQLVNHDYSAGKKDNKFTTTTGEWQIRDGRKVRTVTRVCDYCGYTETFEEEAPFHKGEFELAGGMGAQDESYEDQKAYDGGCYVMPTAPLKDGCSFVCWNTAADGSGTAYQPGDKVDATDDMTFYAVWKENPKPVTPVTPPASTTPTTPVTPPASTTPTTSGGDDANKPNGNQNSKVPVTSSKRAGASKQLPQTGDAFNAALPICLAVAAVIVVAVGLALHRRK